MEKTKKYLVYHYYHRPILAVPEGSRYSLKMAWNCYQGLTFRRAIFRWGMQRAIPLHVDKMFSTLTVTPLEPDAFRLESWIELVEMELDAHNILPVIIWPTEIGRGRIYIYLLSEHCQQIGFCKISFNDVNDACLCKEIESIRYFTKLNLRQCKVPALLIDGLWEGHKYIVEEPMKLNKWPRYSNLSQMVRLYFSCIEEHMGVDRLASADEVKSFFWWRRLEETSPCYVKLFLSELFDLICSCSGLPVRLVHGDFGPHNVFKVADQLVIVDWEESSVNGPILTDEIGYYMSVNAKALRRKPKVILRSFGLSYLRGASSKKIRDIMAALAFRRTVITSDTDIYIKHWDFIRTFCGEHNG